MAVTKTDRCEQEFMSVCFCLLRFQYLVYVLTVNYKLLTVNYKPYSTTIGLYFGTNAFMMHQPTR